MGEADTYMIKKKHPLSLSKAAPDGINPLGTTNAARSAKPQQKRIQKMRVATNIWHSPSISHDFGVYPRPPWEE